MQSILNDDQRLLKAKDAMAFLNNMSRSTFYRNIKREIIPKPRYMGRTPLWKLADLRNIYDQLPDKPLSSTPNS